MNDGNMTQPCLSNHGSNAPLDETPVQKWQLTVLTSDSILTSQSTCFLVEVRGTAAASLLHAGQTAEVLAVFPS